MDRQKEISHLVVHSPNEPATGAASAGPGLGQDPGVQSEFPRWEAGTKMPNTSSAATQDVNKQEFGIESGSGTQIRAL